MATTMKDNVQTRRTVTRDDEPVIRILVATDGERDSQVALDRLMSLPLMGEVHILIVTVVPPLPVMSTPEMMAEGAMLDVPVDLYAKSEEEAAKVVTEAAEQLALTGAEIETATLMGSPAVEIVKAAQGWGADLIVLGCRQRRGLLAWLGRSVSLDVLRNAPCPVLGVPVACTERQRETTATSPRCHSGARRFTDADFVPSN